MRWMDERGCEMKQKNNNECDLSDLFNLACKLDSRTNNNTFTDQHAWQWRTLSALTFQLPLTSAGGRGSQSVSRGPPEVQHNIQIRSLKPQCDVNVIGIQVSYDSVFQLRPIKSYYVNIMLIFCYYATIHHVFGHSAVHHSKIWSQPFDSKSFLCPCHPPRRFRLKSMTRQ